MYASSSSNILSIVRFERFNVMSSGSKVWGGFCSGGGGAVYSLRLGGDGCKASPRARNKTFTSSSMGRGKIFITVGVGG